jgi:HK97 family phage major capsid protein
VAEWLPEASQAADASPSLASPSIAVHKASAFVPFSYEVGTDAINFMAELGRLLADAYDQLSATAFTTGSGTGQPRGIINGLVDAAGTVPLIDPAAAETFSAADIYNVQNALPPRFSPRAQWCANLAIINSARQFETDNGAKVFPELNSNPPMLLSRNINELSNMAGTIDPDADESNYPLLYGSFADGFVIVDRFPSQIELIPNLFGPNGRPSGQRGAFLWARVGSDVVIPEAFRLLSIPTVGSS